MIDETEFLRRHRRAKLNTDAGLRDSLEAKYGKVWDTHDLTREFDVLGFMAPFVMVKRKLDGKKGSLEFQNSPRFYFNFEEDIK